FFFFQAEDGIRDFHVTGVQTCALPIFGRTERHPDQHQDVQAHSLAIPHCSSWLIICRQTTPRTAPSQAIRRRSLITVQPRLKWHILEAVHPPAAQAVRGLAEPLRSCIHPSPALASPRHDVTFGGSPKDS